MISAGIGDDAATALVFGKGRDLVVCATQFECADRLQVFRLEVEATAVFRVWPFDQRCVEGDAVEAGAGVKNVFQGNDVLSSRR